MPEGALAQRLGSLSRVAFSLRDRMSVDHWRTLNRLIADPALQREPALPMTLVWLDRAITSMMTLSGFVLDGMTRGIGWRFVSIGRRIERLSTMCSALQVAIDEGRTHELDWLLDLADSSVTYRSRYLAAPEWLPVLDMVVRDEANPRSIAFQAKGLADFIARLEATPRRVRERDPRAGARRAARARRRASCIPRASARRCHRATAARRLRGLGRDLAEVLLACACRAACCSAGAMKLRVTATDSRPLHRRARDPLHLPRAGLAIVAARPSDAARPAVADGARARARHRAGARRATRATRRLRQQRHPLRRARAASARCACA